MPAQAKIKKTLCGEQNKNKRAGCVTYVVEPLSSKHEVLGSIPNTKKQNFYLIRKIKFYPCLAL
jgi:hypothetical protein